MTTRRVRGAIVASLLIIGAVALAPAVGRAQDSTTLPDTGGEITLVGCFVRGQIKSKDRYVLVRPILGTIQSMPEACTSSPGDVPIKLQDLSQVKLDHTMLGQWLEITGRLEGNHRTDAIREVHVKSFRVVPVVPPRVAENVSPVTPPSFEPVQPIAPLTEPEPPPALEEKPVATAGVRTALPKTATSLPLVGLIGFVSLCAAFGLHLGNRLSDDTQ